ncbi:MAG TPA: hypothetical protein DCX52_15065 [Massilia sp.]|nr:hypothetical protein [Massilia sp.]
MFGNPTTIRTCCGHRVPLRSLPAEAMYLHAITSAFFCFPWRRPMPTAKRRSWSCVAPPNWGHRHAQFDFAKRHERGDGIEANLDEALHWYQKSAEQGDPLAKQRLTLGVLLS